MGGKKQLRAQSISVADQGAPLFVDLRQAKQVGELKNVGGQDREDNFGRKVEVYGLTSFASVRHCSRTFCEVEVLC
jgi:hypothetical protein